MALKAQYQNIITREMQLAKQLIDTVNELRECRAQFDLNDVYNQLTGPQAQLDLVAVFPHLTQSKIGDGFSTFSSVVAAAGDLGTLYLLEG